MSRNITSFQLFLKCRWPFFTISVLQPELIDYRMYSRYEQVPPNGNVNTFSENRNNIQKSSLNMMNLPKPRPILGREKGNKTSNNLKSNIMSEVTTQSNRDITKIKSFGVRAMCQETYRH
ncbi:hypothetical protein ABEB36_010481 [Hypothenemus hampei]|uniref:Uncharacterized protein n=1 Tax=Hypothenemus hampei TaxID=57062 RepID=A0ABD1EJW2_HYPHA